MKLSVTIAVILTLSISFSALAQQSVGLRSGEHDTYSRLVFDWPEKSSYEIKNKTSSSFDIVFDKEGAVNAAISAENVPNVDVLSQNPLVLRIFTLSNAQNRVFAVANRVVVDVYDPEGKKRPVKKQKPEIQKKPEVVSEKQIVKPSDRKNVEVKNKQYQNKVELQIGQIPGVIVDGVNQPKQEELQDVPSDKGIDKNNIKDVVSKIEHLNKDDNAPVRVDKTRKIPVQKVMPNLVNLASTSSFGLSAFENRGVLWMVMDREEPLSRPQINGPNKDLFAPVEEQIIDGGHAFIIPIPKDTYLRSEGSGLAWNVVVSPEKKELKPVEFKRFKRQDFSLREGRLILPLRSASKILEATDPYTGDVLRIVTVGKAEDFTGPARDYVDFEVYPSYAGMAIRPKVDDLQLKLTKSGLEISRLNGLSILPDKQIPDIADFKRKERRKNRPKDPRRIFHFDDWRMSGAEALNDNRNHILSMLHDLDKGERVENLLMLSKSYLAHGRGAEAIGFLNFAVDELPSLEGNPEFMALYGMALAFDWKTDDAFEQLSDDILNRYNEIQYWRSFALADLGDWQQAYEVLPESFLPIHEYPDEIRNRLAIVLAEVLLRAGELEKADELFRLVKKGKDSLNMGQESALNYLKGEGARQRGKFDETKKLWSDLAKGGDNLYRVKSGLALTRLLDQKNEIKPEKAIDNLERLRFAWRGDELEAQVNYWLGRSYFDNGEYVKGLKILREAASLVPKTQLGSQIARDMSSIFTTFYKGDELSSVSPLDAISLYQEFTELTPPGEEGNMVVARLAERLVQADLLDRASELLEYQIKHRLPPRKAASSLIRLAAIRLIDQDPQSALSALDRATGLLQQYSFDDQASSKLREVSLLKARALAQSNMVDDALEILNNIPTSSEVNKLKADIAWNAGYWDDAAFALEDVILDKNISLTRPLEREDADLILQRTVALNLSGDRIGLANIREKYAELMSQTLKADLFEVITRPRQNAGLADRETLLSAVSEVDLFAGFLESYKDFETDSSN